MAPRSLLSLLFLLTACHGATTSPRVVDSREVPITPSPDEPPPPDAPGEPPPPPPETDECQVDADCGPEAICSAVIIAACPTCEGGRVVRQCKTVNAGCPAHIDCMPPLGPDEIECPPRWVVDNCPDTSITW